MLFALCTLHFASCIYLSLEGCNLQAYIIPGHLSSQSSEPRELCIRRRNVDSTHKCDAMLACNWNRNSAPNAIATDWLGDWQSCKLVVSKARIRCQPQTSQLAASTSCAAQFQYLRQHTKAHRLALSISISVYLSVCLSVCLTVLLLLLERRHDTCVAIMSH